MANVDRLFVPLSREPFEDFRDRGKKYEIRAYGRNFTTRTIYPNRKVELRLGYSLRDPPSSDWQLWGTIQSVQIGPLEDLLTSVNDYRLIEPTADSLVAAIRENKELLGEHETYIRIGIELD